MVDETIEDLKSKLNTFSPFVGKKIKHDASLGYYHIVMFVLIEQTLAVHVIYESAHRPPIRWSRPVQELFDGRFTFMPAGDRDDPSL